MWLWMSPLPLPKLGFLISKMRSKISTSQSYLLQFILCFERAPLPSTVLGVAQMGAFSQF